MHATVATPPSSRSSAWTLLVVAVSAPLLAALCVTLWRIPFPINEAIALFEDAAQYPVSHFLIPESSYYRPAYHLLLMAIWRNVGALDVKLALIRLPNIVPIAVLIMAFIWHVRPRNGREAWAALLGVAVLFGSPGLRDNLEIPLSYTAVGMPLALLVWMLVERERHAWTTPLVITLFLLALGFKEQGLVIVPLVVAAWWMGARGASRTLAVTLVGLTAAYIAFRLATRGNLPMFEQSLGLWFSSLEPPEAVARFGAFPYGIYAYNGASTVANILFSEPRSGLFFIVRDAVYNQLTPWDIVTLLSSIGLTILIGVWAVGAIRLVRRNGWTEESRAAVAMILAVLACGALSFNYSRDRLGGMAVPFYALAGFYAARSVLASAASGRRGRALPVAVILALLSVGWGTRALGTLEHVRLTAYKIQLDWLTELASRRQEFKGRPTYLMILESMIAQGTAPGAPRPGHYPAGLIKALVPEPKLPNDEANQLSFADAIQRGELMRAYSFIREGLDPNALIGVKNQDLTSGRGVLVSPLLWAVATQNADSVEMLFGAGATIARSADANAACLARALDNSEIVELLQQYAGAGLATTCPPPRAGESPLLSAIE